MWNISVALSARLRISSLCLAEGEGNPKKGVWLSLFRVLKFCGGWTQGGKSYSSSMIPLFNPMMAAWVRSLAPNLERMDLTRLLTVSSVIES